jgi:hypothetical protein
MRAARSQAMFREVNERIVELTQTWPAEPRFVCECESTTCVETLNLTTEEYEAVRGDPGCFLVAPGHDVPDVEVIVGGNHRYIVVRKLGRGHELAVEFDPRKDGGGG